MHRRALLFLVAFATVSAQWLEYPTAVAFLARPMAR